MAYKSDQGRHARMFAFWSLALLVLFGSTWLHGMLASATSLSEPIGGIRLPIVGIDLTGAFLISFVLFVVLLFVVARFLERPKYADALIDTESELKKVTWPSWTDVVNSSIVVVACVIVLGLFLAGTDWVLARLFRILIFGKNGA